MHYIKSLSESNSKLGLLDPNKFNKLLIILIFS